MTFAYPSVLWLLLLIPLVAGAMWWQRGRPGLRVSTLSPMEALPATGRTRLRHLPLVLRLGALALGVMALARPQVENIVRTRSAEGIDIMLVLDTSTSMRAEDFDPNRFEAARDVASEFIDSRVSDRVGLVVFAAKAFTQAPLTLDYTFLQQMLDEVRVGAIQDGTAIGTALAMAANRLKDTDAKSKVMILLTDGQNNRGEIDPQTASEVAQAFGVRVYAIGVGTRGRVPFPFDTPFRGSQQRQVPVQIDEDMLRTVAQTTGGRYFRAESRQGLRSIYDEIGALETTEIDERVYTDVEERYGRFLMPAFLLLLLELTLRATVFRRFP